MQIIHTYYRINNCVGFRNYKFFITFLMYRCVLETYSGAILPRSTLFMFSKPFKLNYLLLGSSSRFEC